MWYGLTCPPNGKPTGWFEQLFDEYCIVLPVDRVAGELRGRLQSRGRPRTQADMLIAATAKLAELTVATRNVADFSGCGVHVFDPWSG